MTKAKSKLYDVILNPLLTELLSFFEMGGQLTAPDETHDKVQSYISLEAFIDVDDEGMSDFVRDLFLLEHRVNFVVVKDFILADALHGVVLFGLFVLDEVYFAETSLTDHFDNIIVLKIFITEISTAHIEL